jgi:hypothetical protein
MTCEEFIRTLDEEGAPTPAAAEHARSCAACRRELERWSAVRAGLHAMRGEVTPPFLHTRVMARLDSARAARTGPGVRLPWLRPAIAGPLIVLALAAGLGGLQVWRKLAAPEGDGAGTVVAGTGQVEKGSQDRAEAPAAAAPETARPSEPRRREGAMGRARKEAPPGPGTNEIAGRVAAPEQPPAARWSASPAAAPVPVSADEGVTAEDRVGSADTAAAEEVAFAEDARVERAKAAPAAPRLAARAMRQGTTVTCRVETEEGILTGTANLPLAECPAGPPGRRLVVAEEGTMVVLDPASRTPEPPSPAALAALRGLSLRPGRYRLAPTPP